MASKSVRVDEEAYKIALQYGRNLTEGIMTMHKLIERFDKKLVELIEATIRETIRDELEALRRY